MADAAAGAPEMPEPVALVTSLLGDHVGFTQPKGMRMRKRDPIHTADQLRAHGQAMAEHARRVDIEEMAGVINDAAIRYAGGYETDWRDVAKQALAAAQTQGGT